MLLKMDDEIDFDFEYDVLDEDAEEFKEAIAAKKKAGKSSAHEKRKRIQPVRKIERKWTEEEEIKLISAVEAHNCIWDASSKEYKDKTKRERAWRIIQISFGNEIPIQQLSLKSQTLRNQHRVSLNNAKKTKSGQGAEVTPHWRLHSHMAFVDAAAKAQTVASESNLDAVSFVSVIN